MTRFVTSSTAQRREMAMVAGTDETESTNEILHREHMLCKAVMETLLRCFPGYPWQVGVGGGQKNDRGEAPRAVVIRIPQFMPVNKGYVIPCALLMQDFNSAQRYVREAGGHILERYRQPRAGFEHDAFVAERDRRLIQDHKSKVPE